MWLEYDENYSVSSEGEVYSKRYNRIIGDTDTVDNVGYKRVVLNGKTLRIHDIVGGLFLPRINSPGLQIDHINGNKTDNRASNLRWCSTSVNRRNTGPRLTNTTGHKNIYFDKANGSYRVMILHKCYGRFTTVQEAIKKRDEVYNAIQY
jgi:hypothetical protein